MDFFLGRSAPKDEQTLTTSASAGSDIAGAAAMAATYRKQSADSTTSRMNAVKSR